MPRSAEARRKAQRRYAKTPKGRAAAARQRLVWYEQKQVRLPRDLRALRRIYLRVKKRCQKQGKTDSELLEWFVHAIWAVSKPGGKWDTKLANMYAYHAQQYAKRLDVDPYFC